MVINWLNVQNLRTIYMALINERHTVIHCPFAIGEGWDCHPGWGNQEEWHLN